MAISRHSSVLLAFHLYEFICTHLVFKVGNLTFYLFQIHFHFYRQTSQFPPFFTPFIQSSWLSLIFNDLIHTGCCMCLEEKPVVFAETQFKVQLALSLPKVKILTNDSTKDVMLKAYHFRMTTCSKSQSSCIWALLLLAQLLMSSPSILSSHTLQGFHIQ